jgi:peptidyl-prolyl cis-trans isomerase C
MKAYRTLAVTGALSLMTAMAVAADVATVNGQGISQAMLEENVKANVAQGQKDTPELRKTLVEELINRALMSQNAEKTGLTNTKEARISLEQLKENYEAGLAFNAYITKNPVTDAEIRADYDRQIAALGGANAQQYQLSMIVMQTKIEAEDVIAKLKKGASFEQQAKDRSVAPSKPQGGKIGWVFPAQLPPELGGILAKLNKGAYTTTPIEIQGAWYILKVDDKRPFRAPTFDESKDRIRGALTQQKRAEFLKQLRDSARITVN